MPCLCVEVLLLDLSPFATALGLFTVRCCVEVFVVLFAGDDMGRLSETCFGLLLEARCCGRETDAVQNDLLPLEKKMQSKPAVSCSRR